MGHFFWVSEENLPTNLGFAAHRRDEGVCCLQFWPRLPLLFQLGGAPRQEALCQTGGQGQTVTASEGQGQSPQTACAASLPRLPLGFWGPWGT